MLRSCCSMYRQQDIAYYIPGWLRTGAGDAETWNSFMSVFPAAQHVLWSDWPGNGTWESSLRNSEAAWPRLVDELAAMSADERARIILVGHSLGARIVIRTLSALSKRGLKIKTAVLLGAAMPNDDYDLELMGRGAFSPILAICNPLDVTLKYFYATVGGEGRAAFGTDGSEKELFNVKEYSVPTAITRETEVKAFWGKSTLAKQLASHHALFYLAALHRILQDDSCEDAPKLVPQGNVNLNLKVMDAGVWWNVLEEVEGWKLEQNILTGHCRILNPNHIRIAWGGESVMRRSFAKVKRSNATRSGS